VSRLAAARTFPTAGVRSVVLTVAAVHALWIVLYLAVGHQPRDFIKIGTNYVTKSHSSQVIRFDPHYRYPRNHDGPPGQGYDGQFSYYMALDLGNARHYMDRPGYRYTRVLYPLVVKGIALNRPGAVPAVMIVVNWLAVVLGTLAIAVLLSRHALSPWFALIYGLFPGLAVSVQRDLTEPLAYGLVAAAVLVLDVGGRRRWPWVALLSALAMLARQTTVVFPVCVAVGLLVGDSLGSERPRGRELLARLPVAVAFLVIATAPYFVYAAWLGDHIGPTTPHGSQFDIVPLRGIIESHPWRLSRQVVTLITVVLPAALATVVALRALAMRVWRWEVLCLLLNALLFAILLGPGSSSFVYTSTGRNSTGVVLAALICMPLLRSPDFALRWRGHSVSWILPMAALWLCMLPVVMVYGFANFHT
jgi:hypothetical protein